MLWDPAVLRGHRGPLPGLRSGPVRTLSSCLTEVSGVCREAGIGHMTRNQSAQSAHLKKAQKPRQTRPGSREAEAANCQRKQSAFLAAFAEHATVAAAAKAAHVGRRTHYNWLETDDAYAARFKDVDESVTEALEAEARRRAQHGVDEPVHYQGKKVDTIRRYSDTLLIFLLKARRPEMYRERVDHSLTGPNGGPVIARWQNETEAKSYSVLPAPVGHRVSCLALPVARPRPASSRWQDHGGNQSASACRVRQRLGSEAAPDACAERDGETPTRPVARSGVRACDADLQASEARGVGHAEVLCGGDSRSSTKRDGPGDHLSDWGAAATLWGGQPGRAPRHGVVRVVVRRVRPAPASLFSEVLSKALADHLGYAIFAGTIKGKNQLYRTYEAAKDAPDWFALWQDVDQSLATEADAATLMLSQAMHDDRQTD